MGARKRDPADRCRHIVRLTPAGMKALAKRRALPASIDDDFLAPLDADDRKTLHTLLHRLATHHDPRYGNGHSYASAPRVSQTGAARVRPSPSSALAGFPRTIVSQPRESQRTPYSPGSKSA